jgi:hypothetical protein
VGSTAYSTAQKISPPNLNPTAAIGSLVQIYGFIGKSNILIKYQSICSGGKKLTTAQFDDLREEFSKTFENNAITMKTKPNFEAIQHAALEVFNEMIQKSERGDFDYCSCVPFFQRTSPYGMAIAKIHCSSVCTNNTLEQDTEEYYFEE